MEHQWNEGFRRINYEVVETSEVPNSVIEKLYNDLKSRKESITKCIKIVEKNINKGHI